MLYRRRCCCTDSNCGCSCCQTSPAYTYLSSFNIDGPYYNPMRHRLYSNAPPEMDPVDLGAFDNIFSSDLILTDIPAFPCSGLFQVYDAKYVSPGYGRGGFLSDVYNTLKTFRYNITSDCYYYGKQYLLFNDTTYHNLNFPNYFNSYPNDCSLTCYVKYFYIICKDPIITKTLINYNPYDLSNPTATTDVYEYDTTDPDRCYIVAGMSIQSRLYGIANYLPLGFQPNIELHELYDNMFLFEPIKISGKNCCVSYSGNVIDENKESMSVVAYFYAFSGYTLASDNDPFYYLLGNYFSYGPTYDIGPQNSFTPSATNVCTS